MQLITKLSNLSDKLLPHTEFTVPLSLEACQERLTNNLYLRVLPNSYQTRPYKIYETAFSPMVNENADFSVSFENQRFKVVGYLAPCSVSKTYVKASIKTPSSSKLIDFLSIFIGHVFVFYILVGSFYDSTFAFDKLLLASFCAIFPTLFWGPVITLIILPLIQRKSVERFLKSVEYTLKSN